VGVEKSRVEKSLSPIHLEDACAGYMVVSNDVNASWIYALKQLMGSQCCCVLLNGVFHRQCIEERNVAIYFEAHGALVTTMGCFTMCCLTMGCLMARTINLGGDNYVLR
jgi:hypothetical protein